MSSDQRVTFSAHYIVLYLAYLTRWNHLREKSSHQKQWYKYFLFLFLCRSLFVWAVDSPQKMLKSTRFDANDALESGKMDDDDLKDIVDLMENVQSKRDRIKNITSRNKSSTPATATSAVAEAEASMITSLPFTTKRPFSDKPSSFSKNQHIS